MKILKWLGRVVLLLFVAGYLGLVFMALKADQIIFQPHPSSYSAGDLNSPQIAKGAQYVQLASAKYQIAAIYLPNPAARYTLLFSHGNAEDLGDDLPMLAEFRNAGFAVLAYDYRGYGLSQGTPSERGLYEDAEAAYGYVTGTLLVPPERIFSMGRSLGCAAAVHLASRHQVAALIIESPFLSAFRVITRIQILPWDKFNNAAKIGNVHCPVLVMHGRADRVVPFWHGERLYAMAHEPKQYLWSDNAGHNDMILIPRYFPAIAKFTAMVEAQQQGAGTGEN